MELLAIFAVILTISIGSAVKLRALGNNTLQQRLFMQHKEAVPYLRITNGLEAVPKQFRYQVGLRVWIRHDPGTAGGSLIHIRWVLTAAHCTIDAETVDVHLGSLLFEHPKAVFHVNRHNIIENRKYNRTTGDHDISLIRIPEIKPSDTIDIVRLPPRVTDPPSHINKMSVLAGWGRTSTKDTTYSPKLHYFMFTIINNEVCGKAFPATKMDKGRLCTAAPHRISGCHGDSGGPLVLLHEKVQIGVLSFGDLDCEAGFPMVFTRVDSYLDWIYEHIPH